MSSPYFRMPSIPRTDSDDNIDTSTAPTTPDGSIYSPFIHATRIRDAIDGAYEEDLSNISSSVGHASDLDEPRAIVVQNICCVGAGYVGGPTSAVIAFQNPSIHVNVVDRDPARIARWNSQHLPIHEDGLTDIVRIARDGSNACSFYNTPAKFDDACLGLGRELGDEISILARKPNLFFSTDVAKCIAVADIILITVNTPTKIRGMGAGAATDMSALESATREIAIHAKPGAILVEKSTVPSGTSSLIQEILELYRPGVPFEILSNPEFLAEGTAVKDLLRPDRVIIGSSNTPSGRLAAASLAEVYAAWVPYSRITTINIFSSELAKLVANAMLAQRISSINSISAICEGIGANISEIAKSIGLDPRIGPHFLQAGLGFGGSCFKKDILSLVYLAMSLNLEEVADYWRQVLTLNEFQRDRFARRVVSRLNNTLVRKKITLLGYAFKENTSDTRETPSLEIIRTLLLEGPAEIAIYDPYCNPADIEQEIQRLVGSSDERLVKREGDSVHVYKDIYEACKDSHAVLLCSKCDQFRYVQTNEKRSGRLGKIGSKNPLVSRKRKEALDPRPFQSVEPSEADLLALRVYHSQTTEKSLAGMKFLDRYVPEKPCPSDCSLCDVAKEDLEAKSVDWTMDWRKVADGLQKPKFVFDGRNILDDHGLEELRELGVRVESIGRPSEDARRRGMGSRMC